MNYDSAGSQMIDDVLPDPITSRLSIFKKTTPELRSKLGRAILNYDPVSYRAIHKKFGLPELGVSFTAFYRYARKLRAHASMLQLAANVLDSADGPSLAEILPGMICQHLVDQIMANDGTGADAIYRLTMAHRAALKNASLSRIKEAAAQTEPRRGSDPAEP